MRPMLIALLLLILLPLGRAEEEPTALDVEAVRLDAIMKLTKDMEELATWCEENKLYRGRDKCYGLIILFNVDHEVARETLKYYRRDEGEWKQHRYKEPADKGRKAAELALEYEKRIEECKQKFVTSLFSALEQAGDNVGRDLMKIIVADILRVDPDHEKARAMIGEVRLDGKWVLEETKRAKERQKALRETATKLIEEAKGLETIEPTEVEQRLGLTWVGAYTGAWWRGLGTVPDEQLKQTLRIMNASAPFFDFTFGMATKPHGECTMYLLNGRDEAKKALTNHPNFGPSERQYLLGLRAAWVPHNGMNQAFFQWSDNPGVQTDGSVRMAIGILLQWTFDIDTNKGWLWEGGGLWLDYNLTGSHRVVFVTRKIHTTTKREAEFDIDTRMKDPSANWVLLARRLVEAKADPDLLALTKKEVNELTPEDLVYAYSLFAYIVGGYPEKAPRFLMFSEKRFDENVKENFGYELGEFRQRFHRWLEEMT